VAGFIGTPQMNFFETTLKRKGDMVEIDLLGTNDSLKVPYADFLKVKSEYLNGKKEVVLGIRAEKVICAPDYVAKNPDASVSCTVSHTEELGDETLVFGDLTGKIDVVSDTKTGVVFKVDSEQGAQIKAGNIVKLAFAFQNMHFFDKETEKSINPRVPEVNTFDGGVEHNILKFDGLEFALPKALETKDGDVSIEIPTDAFTFIGNQKIVCVKQETISGTSLLHLQSGERTFFAKTDKEIGIGEMNIGLDMKRISILKDGRALHNPLELKNVLYGSVNRKVVKKTVENGMAVGAVINGKKATKKVVEFKLTIANGEYQVPDDMLTRLVTGGGMNVFKKKLRFEFSPYAVRAGEGAISGNLEKTLDYGSEQFAVVKVGDTFITAKTNTELSGDVRLNVDLKSLVIIDDKVDMIIA